MNKFGFGIIGCGAIARFHADAINKIENAQLVGVTDNVKSSCERFTTDFPCKIFDTVEDMLKSDDIKIVSICTPSGLHATLAVKAAKAGKHILVEKPMAITKQQLDDIISAAEDNNVKVAVISQLRFSESIQKVKKAIENGDLGKIILGDVYMKYYRSPEYYASAGWRGTWEMDGGGALMNQGIHGIDVLQYLVGPVKSVWGICKTMARDIEVEDTANVLVEFENGAIGTIQGTTSVTPGYPRILEISGTKGTIVLEEDSITRWDVEGSKTEIKENSKYNDSFRDPMAFSNQYHILQIGDLLDAIENNRKPLVDMYEGRKPVDIILGAYESSKTGKKVEL